MDTIYELAELSINGTLVGLMYAPIALGIVLVFKSSGVANLAQGSMAMVGGYLTWAALTLLSVPVWMGIPLALLVMYALGWGIERVALRPMVGQPAIMIVMLTLGLEVFFRGLAPALFDPAKKRLDIGIENLPIVIGPILINRAYLLSAIVALVMIGLSVLFFRTRRGVLLRAVSDDQAASWSVGIRVEQAIGMSWGLAGVAAGATGVLWGSVLGVDWTLSLLLMKGLAVAILGGLDSVLGVFVASVILGVLENVAPVYFERLGLSGTRDVVASLVILLTILVKPFGLFGRKDIERV